MIENLDDDYLLRAIDRVWSKVVVDCETGCWLFTGAKARAGYGKFGLAGKTVSTHRFMYELDRKIPPGLHLDHLCRVHNCCNPQHLEAVTPRENVLRGFSMSAFHAKKSHCPHGHPYLGDNLVTRKRGSRECRTCNRERCKEYYWRSKSNG